LSASPSALRGLLWKDPLFLLAMAAGPVCWLILATILQPVVQWGWPLQLPWQFLVSVVVYPIAEEIVFRGLIQEMLYEYLGSGRLGPLSVANLLTSCLFTGMHFIYHPPLWAALVFFPSLVFGFFKERTAALSAPIILHAFYNAGFIWLFSAPG
jgi:membrane protease YdiL (CAAX protease family)